MVRKTPWVKESTTAGTAFVVADPTEAEIVDSSTGSGMAAEWPASQIEENTADGASTPRTPAASAPTAGGRERGGCSPCRSASAARVPPPLATCLQGGRARSIPELARQAVELLMQERPDVAQMRLWGGRNLGLGQLRVSDRPVTLRRLSAPVRRCDKPRSRARGEATESAIWIEFAPHQHQERRLEGVVRVMLMPEDLAADPEHHRPVAIDELAERLLGNCHGACPRSRTGSEAPSR